MITPNRLQKMQQMMSQTKKYTANIAFKTCTGRLQGVHERAFFFAFHVLFDTEKHYLETLRKKI